MVRVKICGLTRFEDAQLAAESGADLLGFVLEPTSPRCLQDEGLPAKAKIFNLPRVAVFGPFRSETDIQAFDLIQSIGHAPGPQILAFRIGPEAKLEDLLKQSEGQSYVVLDALHAAGYGGTGHKVDWDLARRFVQEFPGHTILAGGLNPDNVSRAIEQVRPWGVDVSSGIERSPGVKVPQKLTEFIKNAKSAG